MLGRFRDFLRDHVLLQLLQLFLEQFFLHLELDPHVDIERELGAMGAWVQWVR